MAAPVAVVSTLLQLQGLLAVGVPHRVDIRGAESVRAAAEMLHLIEVTYDVIPEAEAGDAVGDDFADVDEAEDVHVAENVDVSDDEAESVGDEVTYDVIPEAEAGDAVAFGDEAENVGVEVTYDVIPEAEAGDAVGDVHGDDFADVDEAEDVHEAENVDVYVDFNGDEAENFDVNGGEAENFGVDSDEAGNIGAWHFTSVDKLRRVADLAGYLIVISEDVIPALARNPGDPDTLRRLHDLGKRVCLAGKMVEGYPGVRAATLGIKINKLVSDAFNHRRGGGARSHLDRAAWVADRRANLLDQVNRLLGTAVTLGGESRLRMS